MDTIATLKSNILCLLALIVLLVCIFGFGFLFQFLGFLSHISGSQIQFLDPKVGVLIGVIIGISLAIPIVYYDKIKQRKKRYKLKTISEQQTTFICPRCKILVDKDPGICPQCNQKI